MISVTDFLSTLQALNNQLQQHRGNQTAWIKICSRLNQIETLLTNESCVNNQILESCFDVFGKIRAEADKYKEMPTLKKLIYAFSINRTISNLASTSAIVRLARRPALRDRAPWTV